MAYWHFGFFCYIVEGAFVCFAYFAGADEAYDKLKRALRAEIDDAAWASLCTATSRPFDLHETGKIAVKVINHYGAGGLQACVV